MVVEWKKIYDGKFLGNILIVGWTKCGKTYFMQKLALHNFFGKLKQPEWVSYIELTKKREAEIVSNFSCVLNFHYPKSVDELNDFLEEFKKQSRNKSYIRSFHIVFVH